MDKILGRRHRLRPGEGYAMGLSSGTRRLSASYCRPQTMAAMPRRAACGRVPLASHRAMNWGGTSTSRTFETAARDAGGDLGLDMTALRFARRPVWTPLAITDRIARRRVKVCAAIHVDLDARSTVRCWDDNGGHTLHPGFSPTPFDAARRFVIGGS